MRPPGPRPESKSVTATPRAARSDAQTAPVTAMGGGGNGDRTRQFERILQERGELGDGGRDGVEPFGCLLPPPMTATLATLMAQCLPAASDGERCARRAGDCTVRRDVAEAGGSRGGDCQTLRPRCVRTISHCLDVSCRGPFASESCHG
jgi:hypothetical protein